MPSSAIIVRAPPTCRSPDECRHSFLTHRGFNAVMEAFFSSVKSEVADRFDSAGEAEVALFEYLEVFYNQRRRHSTLGQISPAAYERQAAAHGVDAAAPMDAKNAPTGTWKTAQNAVSHSAHTHHNVC